MGGLKKKMPFTRATFLIGTLAIAGVPLMSGFFSKDEILWETMTRQQQLAVPMQAQAAWSDGNELMVGGRDGVLLSYDSGSWDREQMPPAITERRGVRRHVLSNLRAVTMGPSGTRWAVSDGCAIFNDSGGGWSLVHQPKESTFLTAKLYGVHAIAANDVWFVGERGFAFHYDGTAFSQVETGVKSVLRTVAAGPDGTVYAAGAAGIILKWNGKAWRKVESTGTSDITGMALVDGQLYGTTGQGTLIKLGSKGWEKLAIKLKGVSAVNSLNAISGGNGKLLLAASVMMDGADISRPAILTRADGAWTASVGEGTSRLRSVGSSASLTVAVGDGGTLFTVQGDTLSAAKTVPTKPGYQMWLYVMALLAAVMTAFYMFRLYLLTFEGEFRGDQDVWDHAHESPASMTIPLGILAFLSVFGGYVGTPLFGEMTNQLHHWLEPVFRIADTRLLALHDIKLAWLYAGLSAGVAGVGILIAWMFYAGNLKHVPAQLAERMSCLYRLISNKFYVDEIYDATIIRPFRVVAGVCYRVFDVLIIDTGLVHGVAAITSGVGRFFRLFHNGDVQQYAVFVVAGLAALIWYVGG